MILFPIILLYTLAMLLYDNDFVNFLYRKEKDNSVSALTCLEFLYLVYVNFMGIIWTIVKFGEASILFLS